MIFTKQHLQFLDCCDKLIIGSKGNVKTDENFGLYDVKNVNEKGHERVFINVGDDQKTMIYKNGWKVVLKIYLSLNIHSYLSSTYSNNE